MEHKKTSDQIKEDLSVVDLFKKAFYTGVGAIFMTEEAIRHTLSEMKLPQEVMKTILKNAEKGKQDIFEIIRSEFHKVLGKYDIPKEIETMLHKHDIEVTIRLSPKSPKKET